MCYSTTLSMISGSSSSPTLVSMSSKYFPILLTLICLNSFVSFGVPGSAVLCLLSGPVFGPYLGFTLMHGCSITGACFSYLIASKLGSSLIKDQFPEKFEWFQTKINENRENLFFYMLFCRLAPIAPNVFINMAAGLVGVPFWTYFFASFFGQIPFSLLYVKTGLMLNELTSTGVVDMQSMIILGLLGLVALIPTYLTKKKDENGEYEPLSRKEV